MSTTNPYTNTTQIDYSLKLFQELNKNSKILL